MTVILLIVMTFVINLHCQAQNFRGAGGFGFKKNEKTVFVGQLLAGYQTHKIELQADMLKEFAHAPGYFGATIGPVISKSVQKMQESGQLFKESVQFRPYLGYYFRKTGNRAIQDRYIHNGITTVLEDNIDIDSWNASAGLQVIYGPILLNTGGMFRKHTNECYITVLYFFKL